jgi:hypothetical protein
MAPGYPRLVCQLTRKVNITYRRLSLEKKDTRGQVDA